MENVVKTYRISQIKDYFLSCSDEELGDLLSNLKLQKLCYYAAGIMNAVRELDEPPLFEERLEAWQHGPVVPKLYHELKSYGGQSIPPITEFDYSVFSEHDRKVLDDVYAFYGQFSAWKLRDMTHEEEPWKAAYGKPDDSISRSSLKAYFVGEVGKKYVETYREASSQG